MFNITVVRYWPNSGENRYCVTVLQYVLKKRQNDKLSMSIIFVAAEKSELVVELRDHVNSESLKEFDFPVA